MHSSGINVYKLGYHLHKNETLCLLIIKLRGMVYNKNSKGPRTEPCGMPNRNLQTSDKVEPIFID